MRKFPQWSLLNPLASDTLRPLPESFPHMDTLLLDQPLLSIKLHPCRFPYFTGGGFKFPQCS